MIPESFEQFRAALLEDLHRTVFESSVKIFLGTMDKPCFVHETFGEIFASTVYLPSVNYVDIRNQMIQRIGLDLLAAEKKGFKEAHIWIYQVPTPWPEDFPCIRYASHYIL